jgi:hypothetical protein
LLDVFCILQSLLGVLDSLLAGQGCLLLKQVFQIGACFLRSLNDEEFVSRIGISVLWRDLEVKLDRCLVQLILKGQVTEHESVLVDKSQQRQAELV